MKRQGLQLPSWYQSPYFFLDRALFFIRHFSLVLFSSSLFVSMSPPPTFYPALTVNNIKNFIPVTLEWKRFSVHHGQNYSKSIVIVQSY